MTRTLLGRVTCVVALAAATAAGGAEKEADKPTISVSGTGKLSAVPDLADIQVGVRTQASTAQKALAENSRAMNALHETLKERGVAAKDIQTTHIQISPQYSQPAPPRPNEVQGEFVPRVVGYAVDNTVQITARDVSKLGTLLDALVQAGANQVHGISFRVDQPEKLFDELRRRAMADAKHRAELLAGEAGVALGLPLKIEETGAPSSPPHFPGYNAGRTMMMAAAPTPVSAGEQELSVTVHVVYELKPPR
jgi:uncharacterized protein YggE